MFIVTLKYPVSITSLNRKQPHVLSIVWVVHCRRSNYLARYESRTYVYAGIPRHTVPAFFLKCVVLQLTMKYSRTIPPSLPCEYMLYCNIDRDYFLYHRPSLPCEYMLYCNLKWHYRLLRNFNLVTNDKGVILVHLYFRHFCQGP